MSATRTALADANQVKQLASHRWPEILTTLIGIPASSLDGQHHPRPKCSGEDRFRLIDKKAGALYCNQCFNTKNGDGIAALQWTKGRPLTEAVELVARQLGVDAPSRDGTSRNAAKSNGRAVRKSCGKADRTNDLEFRD